MPITTSQAFFKALQASKLLSAAELASVRQMGAAGDDPRVFAKQLVDAGLLTRWQAGQLLIERPSFFVGKYKLIDLLGKGGMGSVFLARHTMMNRPVALKMMARQLSKDQAALERFLAEARAVSSLDHPNIIHAYNVDSEDDRFYMVMEYVEGLDLQRMVERDGPLDFDRAADYIRQAAEGLAHAHGKGLIHCDIKPANLLVNTQGVVKILDLGMARFSDKEADSKIGGKEQSLVGTIDYMAPEQAMASPNLDHRADVYSLGCTLYFVLTGRPPFPEGSVHERILKHQTQQPQSVAELRPGAPRDLVRICQKMMAKEPAERYASAEEVARALAERRPAAHRVRKAVALTEEEVQELLAQESGPQEEIDALPAEPRSGWFAGRRLLVAGGVASLAGLVLVVIAAAWMMGGSGGRQAAAGPAPADPPRTTAVKREKADPWAGLQPPDAPNDAKESSAAKGEEKKASAGSEDSKKPKEEASKEKPKPASEKPKPDEPPKDSSKEKPKENPKQEKPKEEKPKEEPQQKPAAGNVDPFKDFPKAVDLPALAERAGTAGSPEAVAIGPLAAEPKSDWSIRLIGGETALRGSRQFTVASSKAESGKPQWLIQVSSGEETENVARLWGDREGLMFQWLDKAASASANVLRNCLLELQAGEHNRVVPLRTPVDAEPLTVDLQRGSSQTVIVDWPPDPSLLQVEFLKQEGVDGLSPKLPGPAAFKTPIALMYSRKSRAGRETPMAEVRAQASVHRPKIELDLKLIAPPPAQLKPLPVPARSRAEEMAKKLAEDLKHAKSEAKPMMERNLDVVQTQLWYDDFIRTVHNKARLHFRIFAQVGEHQVDIVRTPLAAQPEK